MPSTAPFDAGRHVRAIETQGYSIAEGVLSDAFCDELIHEIERMEAIGAESLPRNAFTGYRTARYFDLLNRAEIWQRVAVHPPLLAVLRGVLGNDMLLSTMDTAVIGPGEPAQPIHCDDALYGIARPHKHLVCNTMWALSDFREQTGATRLVPGSHVWPNDPTLPKPGAPTSAGPPVESIPAIMSKGSVCFVVGTLYHGGGANNSTERRWALTINYCAGCMRQQENLMLALSNERVARFAPALQNILGYRLSLLGVGHVDAGDPKRLLSGKKIELPFPN